MLAGCTYESGDPPVTGGDTSGTPDTGTPNAAYETIISGLQKELADLQAEQREKEAAYEARIKELEGELSELQAKIEAQWPENPSNSNTSMTLTYELRDGQAWITGTKKSGSILEIPQAVNGYSVVGIAEGAFRNLAVEQVILPEGLQTVDWFAFSGCYKLRSVVLPASVTSIGYGAFDLCSASIRFTCPANSYAAQYAKSYGIPVSAT